MTLCKGLAPGVSYGKKRYHANAQRCGALPIEGIEYCAAHAKAYGYRRCVTCDAMMRPAGVASRVSHVCPTGCAQPDVLTRPIDRKDPPF